jgi:hypothetical protein
MNPGGRVFVGKRARRRDRRERLVARADLRMTGAEADPHVRHVHPGRAGRADRLRQPVQIACRVTEAPDDALLDIHDQQHGRLARTCHGVWKAA